MTDTVANQRTTTEWYIGRNRQPFTDIRKVRKQVAEYDQQDRVVRVQQVVLEWSESMNAMTEVTRFDVTQKTYQDLCKGQAELGGIHEWGTRERKLTGEFVNKQTACKHCGRIPQEVYV